MADLKNDPSLKKVPEKFKVIMTEVAENIKQNGSFTGFVYGSQAEQYIRTWNPSDQAQLKAALDEYAAKHNGVLEGFTDLRTGKPLVDSKTGKAPTPDAFLQQLGELSVNHMATAVKTPTLKVGDQKITAIGQPAAEEQQKKDEEKKGWFARNWAWFVPTVLAGLGAIGGLIAYLVHKNRKTNKIVPDDKKPVTPVPGGDKDPSGGKEPDNPGKEPDNPGKEPDNPGKEPDNPGKEPDNPGKDDPTTPDNPGDDNPGNQDNPPSVTPPDRPDHGDDGPITGEPDTPGGNDNTGDTGNTPSGENPGSSGGLVDAGTDITGGDKEPEDHGNDQDNPGDIGDTGDMPEEKPGIGDPVPNPDSEENDSGSGSGRYHPSIHDESWGARR